jgi:cytochrome b
MEQGIRIWDPVVRIGHWTIVVAFAAAYFTEEDLLSLHVWAGYLVGSVVAFRVLWGFVGPQQARFSDFVYAPRRVLAYLSDLVRFRAKRYLGHSPAGGAMVLTLLFMLAATVGTGLLTYAADKHAGPLAPLYAAQASVAAAAENGARGATEADGDEGGRKGEESALRELHELLANLTLALVVLHVSGVVLASIVHRENLVVAMITGRKRRDLRSPKVDERAVLGR